MTNTAKSITFEVYCPLCGKPFVNGDCSGCGKSKLRDMTSSTTKGKIKEDNLVVFKGDSFFEIYIDPNVEYLEPRWWHKYIFWKKFKYPEWKIRREYKSINGLERTKHG